MEPLYQNILASLATVVYVKAVIASCEFAVSRQWLPAKVSRKVIHVAAGSWIMFWPLFSTDHWTWKLNILIPAIYTVQLFVKGAIVRDPEDVDIKTMTRTGNPTELLYGPLYFTTVMNVVGLLFFRKQVGICIMACLGYGDGIAPLVGYYLPFGHYPTYPFEGHKDTKTLSGSLAFFVASILGYHLLRSIMPSMIEADGQLSEAPAAGVDVDEFGLILRVAAITTITEGITGKYDNIFIPIIVYAACEYF
jgi:phytol kinase